MSLPTGVRAQRLDTATQEFTASDVPVREPGPGEVPAKVAYWGGGHLDPGTRHGVPLQAGHVGVRVVVSG